MIHWRFLLQKSYIFVCGIAGMVFLTLGFVRLIPLGLYLIPLTFMFFLVSGIAFGALVQRIYPSFPKQQIVFDSALVGFIATVPFGILNYTFAMRIACDNRPSCDWLNYYSIPDMLSKVSILVYILSALVIVLGAAMAVFLRHKTPQ